MSTSEVTPLPTTAGHPDPRETIDEQKLMAAMEKADSDGALREAFVVLSSSMGHVSSDLIRLAMPILGMNVQGIEIDENFLKKAQVENAVRIDREGFIRVMKNIWKGMADSMINEVEKVIDDFISNKNELENIRREFSNNLKDTWKSVADSIINEVEKVIDEFISGNAEQENRKLINYIKDIWKKVTDLKFHEVKKEIDESIRNKVELQNNGKIHRWFINGLRYLWKRVVDSMISQVEKEIDEFISNKTELENGGNIRDDFISSLKEILERVNDSMIKEEVGLEEALKLAHAMVPAERLCSNVSVALFRHLIIPYLGGNLTNGEIIDAIKDVKDRVDDGQINYEEIIHIIRDIQKRVDDSMIKEEVGSEEVLKLAHAIVLAERLASNVSVALLRHLIPYLGGNLTDAEITDAIKDVKDKVDDGHINYEEIIQIIRNIWKKSAEYLSKAMRRKADPKEAETKEAFEVLRNPLDDFASATILYVVMLNLGENLDFGELHGMIYYVKANSSDEQIKLEGFVEIIDCVTYLIDEYPLDKIYGVLTRKETRKVVLSGESGVGKTWMATKIADRATKEGKFHCALWVNLKGLDLPKIIAHQLSLLSASDDMEPENVEEVSEGDKKKSKTLEDRIPVALKNKRVLLIIDGVNSDEEFDEALSNDSKLHKLLNLDEPNHKFLITTSEFGKLKQKFKGKWIRIEVKPWTSDDSTTFLKGMITSDKYSEVQNLAEFYIKQSKGLPAEILIIAKTLNYFVKRDEGLQKLQGVEEVVLKDTTHDYNDYRNIDNLFISTEVVPKIVLVDCYSSETPAEHFLNKRGGVHYNELISYWILEGHLGHFSCIEDAYAEGHRVLMELLDCGLLKTLKAGYVKSSGKKFEFSYQDYFELYQNNLLGLATTFDNKMRNTVLGNGMIKTFPSDEEEKTKKEEEGKLSTLLLDGDRTGEVSDDLFDSMKDLEILAIFNPTHKPFPLDMSVTWNLRFLVLRGCEFLTSFGQVFESGIPKSSEKPRNEARSTLEKSKSLPASLPNRNSSDHRSTPIALAICKLIVLEISGPSSLKTIPENLFHAMENLKSLNMSSLQMDSLPASFYNLTKIEILILKDCSSLKIIESLKKFKKLQLLDLSGATSLEVFKDKSFSGNRELQTINLSQSRIAKFPVVHSLTKLKYLSLSKCPALIRVRKIGSVATLRIFDISGSENVEQLLDPGLQKLENLFALNVSGTAIRRLPSTIGTPSHIHLSNCSRLKQLPPVETLSEVRVLDLSGSALLDDVKPEFITSLKKLVRFNLSRTGVVNLPSLSSLVNLRCLLASQCQKLEKLEGLGSLTNLEVLDLSGCKVLSNLEDKSFDKMDRLDSLDLSETPLEKLPSLSNLKKLKKLNLRGCTKLTNIPGLEDLLVLEDLNISKTTLKEPDYKDRARPAIVHGPKPSSFKLFDHKMILKKLEPDQEASGGTKFELEPHQQASGETKFDPESHQQESEETKVNCDDKTKLTQEEMDQCDHWSIWNRLASHNLDTIDKSVIDAHFVQLLKFYPKLLEDNIKKFHFFVYPMEEASQQFIDDEYLCTSEFVLRKILLGNVFPEAQDRCLEIRGFRDFPNFLGQLLKHAEMIVLIDNSCIRFLSDLGADNLKKMKVCWIERCNEMEYVTDEVKESADILTENIKILWVSEAAKLKSICKETSRGIGFSALTSLYLEYCPELSSLCFSYKQLNGLKVLHVKYCQKLVKLFDDKSAQLPNLESLHLWALPALKEISCDMQSLRTLTVAHCPSLKYIFDSEASVLANHESLQLQVKFCENMKNILRVGHLPSDVPRGNINILGCPKLLLSDS